MKILLTGFNRFGNLQTNPSQLVVEAIAKRPEMLGAVELVTEILPTEYLAAGERVTELIRQHRPDWIVCLGVGRSTGSIQIERAALNLDDTDAPDNAGLVHSGEPIVPEGPAAYWSTLPLEEMCHHLNRRGIPAMISNHAGTFVCNHVFYRARHEVELLGLGSRCGFIHLPRSPEETEVGGEMAHGLPLCLMIEAIKSCLTFQNK